MATKTHPAGTKLQYDLDGTPPFTDVGELKKVKPPGMERADSLNSDLSVAGRVHTYQASWMEPGECEFEVYLTKAQHVILLGFHTAGTMYNWRVLYPLIDAEAVNGFHAFQAYFKKIEISEIDVESDDLIYCMLTLKVSGAITYTAAT